MICPYCRSRKVGIAKRRHTFYDRDIEHVARCYACGYCEHDGTITNAACATCGKVNAARNAWCDAAHLPRSEGMGHEEFAVRAALFVLWKTRPASDFLGRLREFADWFDERDMPEAAACRADWKPYTARHSDPKGWYQWSVPVSPGWVTVEDVATFNVSRLQAGVRRIINDQRAGLRGTLHNGAYFLGWPPGFVRFTGPLYHDHTRYRVTVEPRRGTSSSRPVERVHPHGYATLFHTPNARLGPVRHDEPEVVAVDNTPSLFER